MIAKVMNIVTVVNTIGLIAGLVWFDLASQSQRQRYRGLFAATILGGMVVVVYGAIARPH